MLYGSNVSAKADTNARNALRPLGTESPTKPKAYPPEEEDTKDVALAVVEAEAQHQLLLPVPHQSLQEPVQN
jgi:hypothetical protein